jgi:5-formyltetrahydrofolate cyclo-ligase
MITEKDIARINELYHKSKAEGLTEEEKKEQADLRQAYIQAIRGNIRAQLNNIDLVDENGNVENLGVKYGNKNK